jgi:hypothetical protein
MTFISTVHGAKTGRRMKMYIAIGIWAMNCNLNRLFYFPHPSLYLTLKRMRYHILESYGLVLFENTYKHRT